MHEVFCGGTLTSHAEEAMAAGAVGAEAGCVFLQQPLHSFTGLGHLMRMMLVWFSAMYGASAF